MKSEGPKNWPLSLKKKFPQTEGGINCHNLLSSILQPTLEIQTEKVNTIKDPFRSLVKYKNTQQLYLRLIKTSTEDLNKLNRHEGEEIYWKNLTSLKAFKTWQQDLPDLQDYQEHSVEIKIEGVDNGLYILLASIDSNFSLLKNLLAKQVFYASNISYISNGKSDFYVLDRNSGQPLPGATIQIWERKYNYNSRRYEEEES
jgi:hypothetical protein